MFQYEGLQYDLKSLLSTVGSFESKSKQFFMLMEDNTRLEPIGLRYQSRSTKTYCFQFLQEKIRIFNLVTFQLTMASSTVILSPFTPFPATSSISPVFLAYKTLSKNVLEIKWENKIFRKEPISENYLNHCFQSSLSFLISYFLAFWFTVSTWIFNFFTLWWLTYT